MNAAAPLKEIVSKKSLGLRKVRERKKIKKNQWAVSGEDSID